MTPRLTLDLILLGTIGMLFHFPVSAQSAPGASAPTYNFAYKIAGDNAIAPVQVFDDGTRMHLQFRDLSVLPAILADRPSGKILLKPNSGYDVEPPFVILHAIEPELVLVMNKRQAFVSYKGPHGDQITQTPAMYGAQQPAALTGNMKMPVPVVKGAPAAPPGAAPRAAASGPISPAAPAQPAPPVEKPASWQIAATDLSIYGTLKRWAAVAQWQISWEIPVDFPVTIVDKFDGTFQEAVARVAGAYAGADYPPKACFYENKVVRIVRYIGNGKECNS